MIEFRLEQIAALAGATEAAGTSVWDDVWASVAGALGPLVGDVLDAWTGSSLAERSAAYERRHMLFGVALAVRARSLRSVGDMVTTGGTELGRLLARPA